MAKLLYENKEDIYVDSSIPDKNKVKADDMNEIKEVVNANENKILLAMSDTAPSTCATGDLYYNTTSKKIFEATDTNTWGTTGTNPTPNTIYILFDTKTTYSYDGTDLVSVGGGGAEVAVSSTEPTGEDADSVKIWINPNEAPSGSLNPISNTYGVAQDKGYSQEYVNKLVDYSNTEQVVGVYVDGKPIYKKVISGSISSTTGSIQVPNLETLVRYYGNCTIAGGSDKRPFPFYELNTSGHLFDFSLFGNGYINYNSTWNVATYQITIEYTKTTD